MDKPGLIYGSSGKLMERAYTWRYCTAGKLTLKILMILILKIFHYKRVKFNFVDTLGVVR